MMARLFKFLIYLILIAFAGLVGYAYLGDFQPDQSDLRQPVELQIEN